MPGETDLTVLLKSLRPLLREGEFVFVTVSEGPEACAERHPIGIFHEDEGVTLILPREQAQAAALPYSSVFRMITLSVHSSLDAVGFLAAITAKLARHGISVNPISAYYHDHLFVPAARADEAMALLAELAG